MRVAAYSACLLSVAWLFLDHLSFRQSVRTSLDSAYAYLHKSDTASLDHSGKVLNSYYESVYAALPHVVLPGLILVAASSFLVFSRGPKKPNKAPEPTSGTVTPPAEPGVAPVPPVAHL